MAKKRRKPEPYVIVLDGLAEQVNDPDMPHCGNPNCGCPTNRQMDEILRQVFGFKPPVEQP